MKAIKRSNGLYSISKKQFAKHPKINYSLRDLDIVFIGGVNCASTIKYMQYTGFHGPMAGFCTRIQAYNEHLYEYLIHGHMKPFKYNATSFSGNYDAEASIYSNHKIVDINPKENKVIDDMGNTYSYKALVLNTGLDQAVANMPFIHKYTQDGEFGESRVFVHNPSDTNHLDRNRRIFAMHKDNDFIVYLPEYPSRREAYDGWYLALDSYLSWGIQSGAHHEKMKIRVITPNKNLYKFKFANEVVMEECSNRDLIELHFGWEITDVEIVEKSPNATYRYATFKNKETGEEMRLQFGTLLLTPNNKKRTLYENNDLTNEHGEVTVNPYTLQHTKYPNVFAFGDCANLDTTKSLYATMNQNAVLRTNLTDFVNGRELKGIYEGYSSFAVNHCIDKQWIFSHRYNDVPSFGNFYVPRFLGLAAYCVKNELEKQYFTKVFQSKPNYGWPYLVKDKYFRPIDENKYLKKNNIKREEVLIHPVQPSIVHDHHH